jgi:hypothetical protein
MSMNQGEFGPTGGVIGAFGNSKFKPVIEQSQLAPSSRFQQYNTVGAAR